MNSLPLFSSPVAHAIGWALLHLLWQGVIVAGILAAALKLMTKQSANARYGVSCAALALLLALGVGTAVRAYDPIVPRPLPAQQEEKIKPIAVSDVPKILFTAAATDTLRPRAAVFARSAQRSLPWIVLTWLCGVVFLSSRLMLGWIQTRRIARRNARVASAIWQQTARRLAEALQLRRAVTLLESAAVEVPSVIGWLRPIVLLPTTTLTGLTPEQIEMVLAHEMAHIRRHDFFVNLLQAFVETLMFYHPAVWWMSAQVRIERENCCDDLAVAVCGNPIQYARALTRLEELRATAPSIAVAANGGSLLERIRRIAASRGEVTSSTSRWAAAIALLSIIGIALVVPAIPALAQREAPKPPAPPAAAKMDVVAPRPTIVEVDGDHVDVDDIDIDIDPDDFDFDFEVPEPPEAPELPDVPTIEIDMPEPPDAPDAPDAPDFDFDMDLDMDLDTAIDVDVDTDIDIDLGAPPKIALHRDRDRDRREERREDRDEDRRREDGKLSVDELVHLRAIGVTAEYINEIRAIYPNTSINEITSARAVGVTRAYLDSMRAAGVPVDSLRTAKKLRALGVHPEFIRAARAIDANATIDDIVHARAVGVTAEYVQSLRAAGFEISTIDQATGFKAVGVTAEFARDMRTSYPNATTRELKEARALGVTRAYIEGLRGAGLKLESLRDASRLHAVGVTPEYLRDMRAAGVKIDDERTATQLKSVGVRPDFVRRLAAAGYTNLSVRELTRLAASGIDENFIRDMQKYRTDKQ